MIQVITDLSLSRYAMVREGLPDRIEISFLPNQGPVALRALRKGDVLVNATVAETCNRNRRSAETDRNTE